MMKTPRDFGSWPVAALCVLMLAPLACRRGVAPAPTSEAPTVASQEPAPAHDESVAQRERAVAEREARVAEREAELVRPVSPTREAGKPQTPQAPPTKAPEPTPAPPEPPTPAPREPVEVVVPVGTTLDIEFSSPIASNTVAAGSTFGTRLTKDVFVGQVLAIPAGTEVHGTVTEAVPAKKIGGQARLALTFDHLKLATGETIPIAATFAVATKSQTGKDAATIGGAAAGGAILGNVLDKKHRTKGTVIGAVVGGAIGTAIAANTPGEEVVITAGSVLGIRLTDQVRIAAPN
jgi:hypothetical protein